MLIPRGIILAVGLLGTQHTAQFLAEVRCGAIIVIQFLEFDHERQRLELVAVGLTQESGFHHLLEHNIAALTGALGVANRIEVRRVLAHAHQRCGFLDVQVLRFLVKINLRSHLDAHGIIEEVKLVEIHLDDLVLGVVALEFDGDNPLNRLFQGAFKNVVRLRGV